MNRSIGFFALAVLPLSLLFVSASLAADEEAPPSPAPAPEKTAPAETPAQKDSVVLMEKEGGFLLELPKDWQITEFAGLKYHIAIGPAKSNFAPNLNIVEEKFVGDIDTYVKASVVQLEKAMPEFRKLDEAPFNTESGVEGRKISSECTQMNRHLRQTFYTFKGKDRYFVITCSCVAEDGDTMSPFFDGILKSFKFLE